MLQKFQTLWMARSLRERLLLGGGFAFLLLAILYAYLWQPMQQQRARLHDRLPALREQAQRMHVEMAEVKNLRAHAPAGQPGDLRATLMQSARAQGLRLESITMQDAQHAQVHLQHCAYQALAGWLLQLHDQYHIKPQSAQLKATGQPGVIDGQVVVLSPGVAS